MYNVSVNMTALPHCQVGDKKNEVITEII